MPVRFDAAADRLLRTTDLLDYNAAYTWMGWVYLVSDLNVNAAFWTQNDDTNSNLDLIRTAADGTSLESRVVVLTAGITNATGTNLSVGTWYHVAAVRESATSLKVYLNGVLDSTNTRDITGRAAAVRMEHGGFRSANQQRSDSRVAAIKAWSAALTIGEVQAEVWSIRPQRTANLYGFWPCFPGTGERTIDYSGNGRNWTEVGTLTDEDPAPVSWGAASTRIVLQPVVYDRTGTLTVTGAGDTLGATGNLAIAGSLAVTGAGDTLSSAGRLAITGVLAVTGAGDTVITTGMLLIQGTAVMTGAGDTLLAAGGVFHAFALAPAIRTYAVPAEDRTASIAAEDRTYLVEAS